MAPRRRPSCQTVAPTRSGSPSSLGLRASRVGRLPVDRHGVEVTGQHHPARRGPARVRAIDRVTVAQYLEVGQRAQGGLDGVREAWSRRRTHRGDVDETARVSSTTSAVRSSVTAPASARARKWSWSEPTRTAPGRCRPAHPPAMTTSARDADRRRGPRPLPWGDERSRPSAPRGATAWPSVTDDLVSRTLDVWYPAPALGEPGVRRAARRARRPGWASTSAPPRYSIDVVVRTVIDLDTPPAEHRQTPTCACTCSRHLTGARRTRLRPRPAMFGVLNNVVWTNAGPVLRWRGSSRPAARLLASGLGRDRGRRRSTSSPALTRLRHPRPASGSGTPSRVRLGAHLAPGTTVMHEGFVNFNAGTLGTSMIEGRVSAGRRHRRGLRPVGGGASR